MESNNHVDHVDRNLQFGVNLKKLTPYTFLVYFVNKLLIFTY